MVRVLSAGSEQRFRDLCPARPLMATLNLFVFQFPPNSAPMLATRRAATCPNLLLLLLLLLSLASLGPGDRRATVFSQDSTGLHHGWGSGEARLVSGGGAANALGRCRPLPARRPIWASTACPCFEFAPVSVCKRAGKGNVLDRTRITFICYQTLLVSGSVLRFVLQLRAYCAIVMLIFNHCCSFDPISLVQTLSSHHDFFGHCERRSCFGHFVPKQG